MLLDDYLKKFRTLNVNHSEKKQKGSVAPHKPILLLSIIKLIEDQIITSNHIYLTPELMAVFKNYWELLANQAYDRVIAYPFFYLKSDGFWKLIPKQGQEDVIDSGKTLKSINQLSIVVEYAEIDQALFDLLKVSTHRNDFRQILLDNYLAYSKSKFTFEVPYNQYLQAVQQNILQEDFESYNTQLQEVKTKLVGNQAKENFSEEVFVRVSLFREAILGLYDYSCCVSRMKVQNKAYKNVGMIDACHIEPFKERGNNTIKNGIALTPTLHRAFDRGLIAIDDHFKILVSEDLLENQNSRYNITDFHQQEILLPKDPKFYPSLEALKKHRGNFGFI